MEPASRRVLPARAALANRLLAGGRLRVSAWGAGYVLSDGRGTSTVAADLDALWRACARSGGRIAGWPGGAAEAEVELDPRLLAVPGLLGVWSGAVAHLAPLPGRLRLLVPDPRREGSLRVEISPSTVHIAVSPDAPADAVLSGPAAASALGHLLRTAALPEPASPGG